MVGFVRSGHKSLKSAKNKSQLGGKIVNQTFSHYAGRLGASSVKVVMVTFTLKLLNTYF